MTTTTSTMALGRSANVFDYIFDGYRDMPSKFVPANDIAETDEGFEISISLAGFKKKDIDINVEKNKLIVTGERKKDEKKYNLQQTTYGTFRKSYDLPEFIDTDKVTAKMEDGILNIKIPKNKEMLKSKFIEIK